MIKPEKVKYWGRRKENENIAFRTFLKINAAEDQLDQQFLQLHEEFFAYYDCSQCRNCCKEYAGAIPEADIAQDAAYLNLSVAEFKQKYLKQSDEEGMHQTINLPCDFFNDDGSCALGECKPDSCKKYPYTDQPERLHSLFTVLEAVEVCPVVFEIWERLKEIYGYRYRR